MQQKEKEKGSKSKNKSKSKSNVSPTHAQAVGVRKAKQYMEKKVNPVIEELVTQLLIDQPDDVMAFIRTWSGATVTNTVTQRGEGDAAVSAGAATSTPTTTSAEGELESESESEWERERREANAKLEARLAAARKRNAAFEDKPVTPPKGFQQGNGGWRREAMMEEYNITGEETGHSSTSLLAPNRNLNYVGTLGGSSSGCGDGNGEGSAAPKVLTAEERRAAMRAAAERRSSQGFGAKISTQKQSELNATRKRDALLGRVRALYGAAGQDEPFGLAAASLETLKMHERRMGGAMVENAKRNSKEAAIGRVFKK